MTKLYRDDRLRRISSILRSVNAALVSFENTYMEAVPELGLAWKADPASDPRALVINAAVARQLGIDLERLSTPEGIRFLIGNDVEDISSPMALAYAGHQFGGYSPRLGDGRALLLGEVVDTTGRRFDIHLKGSGRTSFSRGGDGKAAVGPMLREYIISEAMHALGIPTTRSLAVVATGDQIARETWLPGAVLCRVASSHIRVGTFQYAAHHHDPTLVKSLADYAISRHYPEVAQQENPYLAFLQAVADRQAALIAHWMLVGFIHGVMNTDNMTISGETIDYGPCAFMDAYEPTTVYSSIDHNGRYAYGNQPHIAQWNLARLAETLLPLLAADQERAVELATGILTDFPTKYQSHWDAGMKQKLGLVTAGSGTEIVEPLLAMMQRQHVDYTNLFRSLSSAVRGDSNRSRSMFAEPHEFDAWEIQWKNSLALDQRDAPKVAAEMDLVNPAYIARNHNVENALAAATDGNLDLLHTLLEVLGDPFTTRSEFAEYESPAPAQYAQYQTFCGT